MQFIIDGAPSVVLLPRKRTTDDTLTVRQKKQQPNQPLQTINHEFSL